MEHLAEDRVAVIRVGGARGERVEVRPGGQAAGDDQDGERPAVGGAALLAPLVLPVLPPVLPPLLTAAGMVDPPLHAARPSASPSAGVPIMARLSRFTLAPKAPRDDVR